MKMIGIILIIFILLSVFSTETNQVLSKSVITFERQLTKPFKEQYELLILTPAYFTRPLYRLASHKIRYGINTKIVTLTELFQGKYFIVQGRDEPEQIKYFIKAAIENWNTSYVMLVGSLDKMPMRKTWMWDHYFITDLYYSDIYDSEGNFSSWDSNGNGLYGEYFHEDKTDYIDLRPDIGVGRLACENIREVRTIVDKIINYETKTYEKEWFKKIILCGGDTFPIGQFFDWWGRGGCEGEFMNQLVLENMSNFIPIKLWESEGNFNVKSFWREIDKGAGFVYFSGGGTPNTIGIGDELLFSKIFVYTLVNRYKLPVMFLDTCLTARMDYKIREIIPARCFAWTTVAKRGGGTIATIGSTRVAYMGPLEGGGGMLAVYFFRHYNNHQDLTLSELYMHAQNEYLDNFEDRMTLEEYNLLGDPSLKIGGYPPIDNKIKYDNTFQKDIKRKTSNKSSVIQSLVYKSGNMITNYVSSKNFNRTPLTYKEGWPQIYDGGDEDISKAIAIDSKNNVIITGHSYNNSTFNFFTIKYDDKGNIVWNKTYDSGKQDMAYDVTVDSRDNIYVAGFEGEWTWDAYPIGTARVIKYDKNGKELWNKSYKKGFWNIAVGVAVDSEDNIVIAMGTYSGGIPWHICWTVKCNGTDGNEIWNRTYSQTIEDFPNEIAVDSNDNIVVVGKSSTPYWYGYFTGGWLTIKYDKNGNLLWNNRYESGEQAEANDIALDSEDNLIISGFKLSRYIFSKKGNYDFYTLKVDKNGEVIWKKRYDLGSEDRIYGVAVDKNNSIIVGGFSSLKRQFINPNYSTPAMIIYNENGEIKSIGKPNFNGKILDLTLNNNGVIYITGSINDSGSIEDYFTTKLS